MGECVDAATRHGDAGSDAAPGRRRKCQRDEVAAGMTVVPTAPGSADILRTTLVVDDAGAETADRYDWQAMMATADVLAAYRQMIEEGQRLDGCPDALICEHHEDWALVVSETAEIVSAKHREASVGAFSTFRQVLDSGGVFHLFDRWMALGKTPLCRLVTTAGFKEDAAVLKDTCELLRGNPQTTEDDVTKLIDMVVKEIKSVAALKKSKIMPSSEVVRAFLLVLRFDDAAPRRDHLPDMAANSYGLPIAKLLARPDVATAIWQAVLGLVRERMRAAGPAAGGLLPTVLGGAGGDVLETRTLSLGDVHAAVQWAVSHSVGYRPLPRQVKANKMAVKMARGGCSDNAIERADRLRLQYRRHLKARRGMPNYTGRRESLINVIHRVIDEVTSEVHGNGPGWGAVLWVELAARFRSMEGEPETQGLDSDLLLGGVSDLANNCVAWYSDRFDAGQELELG